MASEVLNLIDRGPLASTFDVCCTHNIVLTFLSLRKKGKIFDFVFSENIQFLKIVFAMKSIFLKTIIIEH